MARSWQGYQGTCHGSWQGCHGFEHWDNSNFETAGGNSVKLWLVKFPQWCRETGKIYKGNKIVHMWWEQNDHTFEVLSRNYYAKLN